MLEWKEIPPRAEGKSFTDKEFVVFDGYVPLFTIGLKQQSLITKHLYVWIKPTPYLKAKHLRSMRETLRIFEGYTLFANVSVKDGMSCRFAKALGFAPLAIAGEHYYFERTI